MNRECKRKEYLRVEEKGGVKGKGQRRKEVLPGLFGLEIDGLSLSPNLSISRTHPTTHPLSPTVSPCAPRLYSATERQGENEGQTQIQADRMMECAAFMNRIREEKEGEEVSAEMELETKANKDQQEGKSNDSKQ